MRTVATHPIPCRLTLPASTSVGDLEDGLDQAFRESGPTPHGLVIDAAAVRFLEVPCLPRFLSLMADRHSLGFETHLRLPRLKDVRDFLRIWQFPAAVKDVLGLPFRYVVVDDDAHYFGENLDFSTVKYSGLVSADGLERRIPSNYFALTTFRTEELRSVDRFLNEQAKRWEEPLIESVLEKHLSGPHGYVASRIVFESLLNALRHPQARIIQATSAFQQATMNARKRYLTIVFWDNGESMVDTLHSALREGKAIRSRDLPELHSDYELIVANEDDQIESTKIIRSDALPTAATPPEELLLATLFPGVTRDVSGTGRVHYKTSDLKPELSLPGMGLYVLTNAVVDVFGGSVAFRTASLFMNVRRRHPGRSRGTSRSYRVKIRRYGSWLPSFHGNMITIRLPLSGLGRA
jgi:hypothetical protein